MFLDKYLEEYELDLIYSNYDSDYLNSLDNVNFEQVYSILKKYGFYFINDIILNYIEIFMMDSNEVENKIIKLKNELGDNFVYIIGNDLRYLEKIVE